jgi:NADP-dependent 3-hydroxy acid dehydrogenase YdfG
LAGTSPSLSSPSLSSPGLSPDLGYRTALITGASAGIGKVTALELSGLGLKVTGLARRAAEMADLKAAGLDTVAADVTDRVAMKAIIDRLKPDVVVANAGTARVGAIAGDSAQALDLMMAVNVTAVIDLLRFAIPHMREAGRGHVVLIGSVAGHYLFGGMPLYNVTKQAIAALTDLLRIEVHGTNIRVTEIAPGRVRTDIFSIASGLDTQAASEKFFDPYEVLEPQDIAAAITFAVSAPKRMNVSKIEVTPTVQHFGGMTFAART